MCDCIESILNQTFKNYEIICINDCSSDNSFEILENYKNKCPNFKVINLSEHSGAGRARNEGIKIAKGKYISFVDSDDTISKNFLEELLKSLKDNNAQISACNFQYIRKNRVDGKKIKKTCLDNFEKKLKFLKNGSCCNKLFEASLIKENNITFPQDICFEDNLFLIKAIYYCKTFVTTPKASYYYFSNSNSITRIKTNIPYKMHSTLTLLNFIFDFAKSKNFSEKQTNLLKNFCYNSFIDGSFLNNKNFVKNLPITLKEDEKFIKRKRRTQYSNALEKVFSLKNSKDKTYKIVTILGLKISFERKKIEK